MREAESAPESGLRRAVAVIGVASGMGAPDRRCGEGPPRLIADGFLERLAARGAEASLQAMLYPQFPALYRAIGDLSSRLACEVSSAVAAGRFPVILGGDHSCAIGTWSGAASALAARGPLGLVWIDAHMDSHTPATSATGMPHGMPLAALLGHGNRALVAHVATVVEGHLDPRHVALVGVRSNEPEEAELLERRGVRVFSQEKIAASGIEAVLAEAVAIARSGTAGYGISVDLDALDPLDAPGVGTPVPGGISAQPLIAALAACRDDARLVALEIVEYNPHHDIGRRTATLVEEIAAAVVASPEGAALQGGRS